MPEAIVAAFAALGYAVSARLILLLALAGAFTIAVMVTLHPGVLPLLVLVAYAVFAVIPVVFLEMRLKWPRE